MEVRHMKALEPGDRVLMSGLMPAIVLRHVLVPGDFEGVALVSPRSYGAIEFGVAYEDSAILRDITGVMDVEARKLHEGRE